MAGDMEAARVFPDGEMFAISNVVLAVFVTRAEDGTLAAEMQGSVPRSQVPALLRSIAGEYEGPEVCPDCAEVVCDPDCPNRTEVP